MEQNKNLDERLEDLVATDGVIEEDSSAVLKSESVVQNEDENCHGKVMRSSSANPECAVEPEENWDDDAQLSWTCVIPSSKEIDTCDLVRPSADGNFLHDGAFVSDDRTSSFVPEGSSEGYFPVVEKSSEQNRRRNYSFKYDMKKIFIKNVNFKTSQKILWKFFGGFGNVKYCHLLLDDKGRSTGNAVVEFNSEDEAKAVLSTSAENLSLHGRTLSVCVYRKKIFESKSATVKPEDDKETNVEAEKEREIPDRNAEFDGSAPSPIDRLSDEMIAHILAFLELKERLLAERISRRFRDVSIGYWYSLKKIKIETSGFNGPVLENRHLKSLLSRGSESLISLTLSSPHITDCSLRAIAVNCTNLQELCLIRGQFTNSGLKTLADGCCQLRSFTIIRNSSHQIGEKGLWWIFHRCKMLQCVDVSGSEGLKGQCLHVLGPDITHLSLAGCSKLMDVGIEKVQQSCGKIKDLSVAGCCRLTNVSLFSIGQCTSITSLNIGNILVTEIGLMELRHLRLLEHLVANNIPAVGDDFLVAISERCRQLRTLDVSCMQRYFAGGESNMTDVGIRNIAAHCPLMSSLNISNHPKITDLSVELISRMESMEKLYLADCVNVTDDGVACLITCCKKLCLLDLGGCWRVGNKSLDAAVDRAETNPESLRLILTETSVVPKMFPTNMQNLEISYDSTHESDFPGYEFGFEEDSDDFEDEDDDEDQFFPGTRDDDFDGFLETDDPLDFERWEMS